MTISLDTSAGRALLREAAASTELADETWTERFRAFSQLIDEGKHPRTHVAFLFAAVLAKAMRLDVDVHAMKEDASPNAYSARTLCHGAVVKEAGPLGYDYGVTGREPLNNSTYFRLDRVSLDMRVRKSTKVVIEQLVEILDRLAEVDNEEEAMGALRAYVLVRREHMPEGFEPVTIEGELSVPDLVAMIEALIGEASEGGRRAQAAAAGLMDAVFGEDRVEAGRINDPDRHLPGDVGVRRADDEDAWEKVIEVRDKPVTASDAHAFARKVVGANVREAAILAVSRTPTKDIDDAIEWARERGASLTLLEGWGRLVAEAMFWAPDPQTVAAAEAAERIGARLIEVEASSAALTTWTDLCASRT